MKGDSLRRQTELSEKYAAEHNLTLDDSFKLQDLGISAFDRSNLKKGALGAFLDAVQTGKIAAGSYLLVESLDRLSRDQVVHALGTFISIIRHGITIVTLSDGMVYSEQTMGDNFYQLLMSITIMARAHDESLTKSKRLKAAWANKISNIDQKKLTARCPGWLQLSADKKTFSVIPDRVTVVREIIEMSINGMGQSVIVKRLNDRKIANWWGNGWHTSSIAKILNNTALYGEFQPHLKIDGKLQPQGEPIKDYFPALISKDQFLILKAARNQRLFVKPGSKSSGIPNLLSGIGKCGYCGGSMVLTATTTRKVVASDGTISKPTRKALICDKGRRGLGCYTIRWDYQDLEKSFLSFCTGLELEKVLADIDKSLEAKSEVKTLQEELDAVDARLAENNRRVENLVKALEDGEPSAALMNRLKVLEEEISISCALQKQLKDELSKQLISEKEKATEHQSMQELISQIASKAGDELFVLRSALADKIRRVIKEVRLYPAGTLRTLEEKHQMRENLKSWGFTLERINEYLKSWRTEPERAGGRYASRRDTPKHFVMKARNGGIRIIHPDHEDPTKIRVEMTAVDPLSGPGALFGKQA
jgi:DNA invertase Pin-like site-specific DNA recombinase